MVCGGANKSIRGLRGPRNITVQNLQTGETIHDDCDVLLSARGALNDIAWPKIPGFETFEGEVMHSAAWNQKFVVPFHKWLMGN